MNAIGPVISENIKRIRQERKLSLDGLSSLTGVSKSMLAQIERNDSSPTISTLWKIATGLHIPFTTFFTEENQTETRVIAKDEIEPLLSDNGHFRLYPVFPMVESRGCEMLHIELDKGSQASSDPHEPNTEEFVVVYEGAFSITVDNSEYILKPGDSLRYMADKPHVYKNIYEGETKLCMLIYYNSKVL